MSLLEERTRQCYSETFDDLDSDAFVEMMLLDGCFVLEYFLKACEGNSNSILEVGWNSDFINCDLLLQENQIPFFIVEKLYELIGLNQEFRMILLKSIAYFLLPNNSLFPDPPAEIPDPSAEIPDRPADPPAEIPDPPAEIPGPPGEIPDPPAEIPGPPAEIPDPRAEIPGPPAEIPDHRAEIPGPPAEIPDLPAEFADPVAAIRDIIDLLAEIPDPPAEIHHLVHLCYHYFVPNPEKPVVLSSKSFFSANRIVKGLLHWFRSRVLRGRSPHSTSRSLSVVLPNYTGNISSMVIPSATELKQKGLKFTPKSNPKHMLDISFEYGVLNIPRIEIMDDTKPIFANLMAFEHSKYGKENSPFTSFVAFLDELVNTPNDVTILQECEIIENWLGSEEELTDFINQITESAIIHKDHYLAELFTEVNRYSKKSWNRNRAKLIRDYFSNPWATISVIAAFILLVLTLVQSFFAVFTYFIPPSS